MNTLRVHFVVALVLAATASRAHESPIDHVERELWLFAEDGRVSLVYRLLPTERATLMELKHMDADDNGVISDQERESFFAAKAESIARKMQLKIGEQTLPLQPDGSVQLDPQLGQTFRFRAPLPALRSGRHPGELVDGHSRDYPGGFLWKASGQDGSAEIRFEPVTPDTDPHSREHPPWLELRFDAVVR
jgi:hypothetical protein